MIGKSFYKNHSAIALPFFGAGCIFLLNFYMKSNLNPNKYGDFAGFLLLINTLFLIGSGGVEQLLVRVSKIKSKFIYFNKGLVCFCLLLFFLIPFLSLFFISALNLIESLAIYHYFIVFLVQLLMVLSTLYKLTSNLFFSLFVMNFWKIVLFAVFVLSLSLDLMMLSNEIIFIISIVSSILILFVFRVSIPLRIADELFSLRKTMVMYIASVISILSYVMFDSMDRFVVKEVFTSSQFGDYFFIFNFIMAPVVILSNYLVSRRVVSYKNSFSMIELFKDATTSFIVSTVSSVLMATVLVFCIYFGFIVLSIEYYYTIIIVVLLAGVRSSYAFLSMAYSVVCSTSTLFVISFSFGVFVFFTYLGIITNKKLFSLETCVFLFLVFWLLRFVVYVIIIAADLRKLKTTAVDKEGVC